MAARLALAVGTLLVVSCVRAERIELRGHSSTCVVDTCGGRICSYVEDGTEILWMPSDEPGGEACWRHGGIPLAWPWFGRLGRGEADIHGYAWKHDFKVRSRTADSVVLVLETESLTLTYAVSVRDALRLELRTVNRSSFPVPMAAAFHPYFRGGRMDEALVLGIDPAPIAVTGAVDRTVLWNAPASHKVFGIRDVVRNRTLKIVAEGATGVNLWNPGAEKRCPGLIPGGEWREFVAVEPFVRGVNRFAVLGPGAECRLAMTVGCRLEK